MTEPSPEPPPRPGLVRRVAAGAWYVPAGFAVIVRHPRLWPLAPVMHFPGMMLVAKPVYAWVSRNRYLIAGKAEDCDNGACALPRR